MTTYPDANELGSWIDTLAPAQQIVFDKLADANTDTWPARFFDLVKEIATSWTSSFSSEALYEAIACAVHHNMTGTEIATDLAVFMSGREELVG